MSRKEVQVNGIRWVHINRPVADDFSFTDSLFQFHPLIKESILTPTLHPLIESFEDHMFLIAHFPLIDRGWAANKLGEVDFLITKDLLVTISYFTYRDLEELFTDFSSKEETQKQFTGKHTGFLVHYIIDRLFQKLSSDLDFLEGEITRIEDKIFKKGDKRLVEEISHIRRDVLDFHRWLKPQSAVFKALSEKGEQFYGKNMAPYFADLLSTEERFENILHNQQETIDALHSTHQSLLSSNLNNIIVVLTVFSAIILPLNFIASIWGMNHENLPLRDGPYDFWIVIGLMFVTTIAFLSLFRNRKWL